MEIEMQLATCSYTEMATDKGVAIRTSLGAPRWKLKYDIAGNIRAISPASAYLKKPFEEYRAAYRAQLEFFGVDSIRAELAKFGDGPLVLLCFEKLWEPGNWCHRTLFAQWWQEQTGETVPELGRTS
jgi:hypothetical protein